MNHTPKSKSGEIRKPQTISPLKQDFWHCPKCREVNYAPALQIDENTIECACGWSGKWKEVKE